MLRVMDIVAYTLMIIIGMSFLLIGVPVAFAASTTLGPTIATLYMLAGCLLVSIGAMSLTERISSGETLNSDTNEQ